MVDIRHIAAARTQYSSFDAVIVGSGPSGSIVARTLAERGWRVAILEYGGLVSPGTMLRPYQAAYSKALTSDDCADGNPWTACCVGGGMQFYDAIMLRYRPSDLAASQYLTTDMQVDWPITIQDLEPHYREIERLLGICGTDGFSPYPASPRGLMLSQAMQDLGIRSKSVPLAIRPPGTSRGCVECSACDELTCPTDARASVLARDILDDTGLPGSISVLYGCFANRIEVLGDGRANAIECYVPLSSELIRIPVARVIVCANAIQTTALLLRSRSRHSPEGIGNDAGLAGRGLSFKVSGYSVGFMRESTAPCAFAPHRGPHATVYTDAFYEHDAAPCGFGGIIYESNYSPPNKNVGLIRLHYIAGDEPWSYNRVLLDDTVDADGIPYIRFSYENSENDCARIKFLAERAEDILRRSGAARIERELFLNRKGRAHLHGTLRAGHDARTSVVDSNGKVHGFTNIHVMDGSVMNFPGNSNPTHTIMANARRMAQSLC